MSVSSGGGRAPFWRSDSQLSDETEAVIHLHHGECGYIGKAFIRQSDPETRRVFCPNCEQVLEASVDGRLESIVAISYPKVQYYETDRGSLSDL